MTARERIGAGMIVLLLVAILSIPFFAAGPVAGLLFVAALAALVVYLSIASYLLNNP